MILVPLHENNQNRLRTTRFCTRDQPEVLVRFWKVWTSGNPVRPEPADDLDLQQQWFWSFPDSGTLKSSLWTTEQHSGSVESSRMLEAVHQSVVDPDVLTPSCHGCSYPGVAELSPSTQLSVDAEPGTEPAPLVLIERLKLNTLCSLWDGRTGSAEAGMNSPSRTCGSNGSCWTG